MPVNLHLDKVLRNIFSSIVISLDPIFFLFPRNCKKNLSLLLVRVDNIGDFVLWLDAAKHYRALYPGHYIVLVANSAWSGLAEHFDYWDEIWSVDPIKFSRDVFYRWSVMVKIYRASFNVAIHPTFSRILLRGDSLIRASVATRKIGFSGDLINISVVDRRRSDTWYTDLIIGSNKQIMELDRNAEFLKGLGFDHIPQVPYIPTLSTDITDFRLPKSFFIIFPGASTVCKRWPIRNFAYIADHIYNQTGLPMIICGGQAERELALELMTYTKVPTFDLVGKTTLAQFTEVVRLATLLIGNDTSAIHIAASVRTRSVCIIGGTIFGRFLPYPSHSLGFNPITVFSPSINSISVERVKVAVNNLIVQHTGF